MSSESGLAAPHVLELALPSPLHQRFHYLANRSLAPGTRVRVPFGKRETVGIVLGEVQSSDWANDKLRPILEVLDERPVLSPALLSLLNWSANYYHHPIGEVLFTALPQLLRSPRAAPKPLLRGLQRVSGNDYLSAPRGARQLRLWEALAERPRSVAELNDCVPGWRLAARGLQASGHIEALWHTPRANAAKPAVLHPAQALASDAIVAALGRFQTFLLEGVTGSGKTEVYLSAIAACLAQGRQALLLVPEIGLTSPLLARAAAQLDCPLLALHSQIAGVERARLWLQTDAGEPLLLIGTRSALFAPLPELGLIIVDEEHDGSYKQQDGWRYSARDLAIKRGHLQACPVVLGSATPSLEILLGVQNGRYQLLELKQRALNQQAPIIELLDCRSRPLQAGLSLDLHAAIADALQRDEHVLVFLNRRGYAPALLCHDCGTVLHCPHCSAPMALHRAPTQMHCHHCGHREPAPTACANCGSANLIHQGQGTERIESLLAERYPEVPVIRVDRDSTSNRAGVAGQLALLPEQGGAILVGTQMLAKGHDLPRLTVAALIDVDQGLYAVDHRAGERLAQLIIQVAGRSGRHQHAGRVLLQTHHPEHPLLRTLLAHGYRRYAEQALQERAEIGLPPYVHQCALRADGEDGQAVQAFLNLARAALSKDTQLECYGPLPAGLRRRAGRDRWMLVLSSDTRGCLHRALRNWVPKLPKLPGARRIRYALDVDPMDFT